jgi:phosphoglycerol transferase MdoB-like AlkP superfamily enzyme
MTEANSESRIGRPLRLCGAVWLVLLAFFTLTRLILVAIVPSPGLGAVAGAIGLGIVFDAAIASFFVLPLALFLAILPPRFAGRNWTLAIERALALAAIFLVIFNCVAEGFFWEEFGTRFNFIAVDYLVYTTEVLGNIWESYPMVWIVAGIAALASAATWGLNKAGAFRIGPASNTTAFTRLAPTLVFAAIGLTGALLLRNDMAEKVGRSIYAQEFAKNGVFSFVAAFRNNTLNYSQFYVTMPTANALQEARRLVRGPRDQFIGADPNSIRRRVDNPGPEKRWNVIQITVESLSASFMQTFGNTENITPNLDAAAKESLFFTRFYATGNRTDRGMEALTLSVPPSPGRSIVKRPRNEDLFTVGKVFRERGYETAFIYGGYGYFDNMNYFFGKNGYKVIDRTAVPKDDITFANAWGACDEDALRWAIKEADAAHAANKPFFQFVMTTSNHRPYTYPEGRIDIPSHTGRSGAVKYTDYAIGKFLKDAGAKPWFTNTLVVIVADHCHSSAGKTDLPVDKYAIPLLIYNPQLVQPRVVDTLCSQIDFAPTLFALLGWTYESEFFGKNILEMPPGEGRALIANYQKLGLMDQRALTILKPKREVSTYLLRGSAGLEPAARDEEMVQDAVAYYQSGGYLFEHHADVPKLARP